MLLAGAKKGILSEHLIDVFGIIISVFLIFLIGISLFTRQAESGTESAYASMARQVASAVDRVAAEAGSARIEQAMTRGLPVDVLVSSREVVLSWAGERKAGASFSAPTGLEEQRLSNPASLCIVKSRNDRRIVVQSGPCKCVTNDRRCDASCVVDGICDPACMTGSKDYICLPACSKGGDGICDPDCISAAEDWYWDPDCALADGICDPDSNGVQDGVCDPDCRKSRSVCDPECKPTDANGDKIEDKADGSCYVGCNDNPELVSSISEEQGYNIVANYTCESGIGNKETWRCGGEKLIYSCGEYILTGGYGADNYCVHRYWGEVVDTAMHKQLSTSERQRYINETYPQMMNSEVCCCDKSGKCGKNVTYIDCIRSGKQSYEPSHEYCKGLESAKNGTQKTVINLLADGICDLDCADRADVCDPDCPDYLSKCRPCAAEGEAAAGRPCCSGLVQCPSSGLCAKTCCGNGACEARQQWNETAHPRNWENPCTCPGDCPGVCPWADSCTAGPFTSGICYQNLMGSFYGGKIEVCADAVKDFLDRRMWSMNEVAATTLRVGPPLGWGFDDTRYCGDACGRLQAATTTIEANEAYNSSEGAACCSSMVQQRGCACNAGFTDSTACGVGFCGDHSTALYSILRRLGVPSEDLWVTYTISGTECRPHAFVVMRCNASLEPRLLLDECQGRNGEWLAMDATGHFIRPMSSIGCRIMCLWWNELGLYAQQEGATGPAEGWAYNQSAKCSSSTWEGKETCVAADGAKFSCQFNDYCSSNGLACKDFCKEEGIACKW